MQNVVSRGGVENTEILCHEFRELARIRYKYKRQVNAKGAKDERDAKEVRNAGMLCHELIREVNAWCRKFFRISHKSFAVLLA